MLIFTPSIEVSFCLQSYSIFQTENLLKIFTAQLVTQSVLFLAVLGLSVSGLVYSGHWGFVSSPEAVILRFSVPGAVMLLPSCSTVLLALKK